MSGHNPHSHLSQPNSSWNPLQIPSYIPRQPQLAHMSNERPLVRSPVTWHTPAAPAPPEAFYSFLSANHKNLEISPLLLPCVRGPSPFGSVDLTIQSARNSTTPSPRNLPSPPIPQEFSAHNKLPQQPFPPHHQQAITRSLTPNSLNSAHLNPPSGLGVIQSTGSVRDKFPSSSTNNGEMPQPPSTTGNIFVRDARQINNELAKITARDTVAMEVSALSVNEPVELIKENPYQSKKSHTAVPSSPKRLSPTRPPSIPSCTPSSPRSRSPLMNTGSATDIVNNHIIKPSSGNCMNVLQPQKADMTATITSLENSPLSLTLPPSPTTTTSNEDSVDSQTSKSRRKRKPNKTTRVSNDSDESLQERENDAISLKSANVLNQQHPQMNFIPDKNETLIDLDTNKLIRNNTCETNEVINSKIIPSQSDNQKPDIDKSPVRNSEPEEVNVENAVTTGDSQKAENEKSGIKDVNGESPLGALEKQAESNSSTGQASATLEEAPSVIVNNKSLDAGNITDTKSPGQVDRSNANIMNNCQDANSSPTSPLSNHEQTIEGQTNPIEQLSTDSPPIQPSAEDNLDSPRKRCKRKGDSDDIETIDKIAAMIASTHNSEDINENSASNAANLAVLSSDIGETLENGDNGNTEKEAQLEKSQTQGSGKLSDLAEMLETPPVGSSPNNDKIDSDSSPPTDQEIKTKESVEEKCFEEVEIKLEEMFAGIEDEEPSPCILPPPTNNEPITSEVISELGLGGVPSPIKQNPLVPCIPSEERHAKSHQHKEDEISSKPLSHHNSSQKRSHSNNKSESSPPQKKRKVSKKPTTSSSSSNQKSSTISSSTSTKSSKPHSLSASTSNSNKSTKSNDKHSSSLVKDKVKDEPGTVDYKGPFIQVKSDGTINVINAPITEDIVEKQNKVKKSIHNHSHSDRNKIRGLHVSTLSTKYDADTTDTTWMCVFCKKGPHKLGLGDLFGPYIVTTTCEGFAYSQKDPKDDEFISKRTKAEMFQKQFNTMPVVPAASCNLALASTAVSASISGNSSTTSKKKRKATDSPNTVLQNSTSAFSSSSSNFDINDIYIGMTKVSDTSYEVWVHEHCLVWASGVYIIGARIVGLDTAVWSSTRYNCSICSKNGAMVSCFQRGCDEKAHIPCARIQNWTLKEDEFKSTCTKHSTTIQTFS